VWMTWWRRIRTSTQPRCQSVASSGGQKELGGTWRASNQRRRKRRVQGIEGAEDRDAEGVERVENGEGVPSPAD